MSAERSRRLGWRLEYGALRGFELIASVVPRRAALAIGAAVGSLARRLGVGRTIVVANYRHAAIGDPSSEKRFLRSLYRNMGRYVLDTLRAGRELPPYRIVNEDHLAAVRRDGAIAIAAHYGNFEVLAGVFGRILDDVHVIVKPQHNVLVEEWLDARRRRAGVQTIYQKNAAKKSFTAVKRGHVLAALIDQFPGADGTEGTFLGKPARTVRALAGLQERTGVPAVSVYALLGPDDVYDVVIEPVTLPPSPPPDSADPAADDARDARIAAIQRAHNEVVERWVRSHPDHWFGWFHRRFRPYLDYSR